MNSPVELTPADFTYLHLDTARSPMHWAMVLELAPGPRLHLDEVRARVRERVRLFDLFRLGVRNGRWRRAQAVLTEQVDIEKHVTAAEYRDDADLHRQLAALHETALPRPEPLWHITLFTSAGTGVQYVLLRVHHALSDGIAGAAFAALLADGGPEQLAEFERFATTPRYRIPSIEPEVLKESKAAFEEQWKVGKTGRAWPKLTRSGRREVALTSAPTRDLRRAARGHGASVHEFLLAAIGSALSLAPPRGTSSELLRVTLPVTHDQAFRHTGNAVLVSLVNLLGGEPALDRQLERARAELAVVAARRPELSLAATDDAPTIPWPVHRAITLASMGRMSPDIHIGINPGFSQVRAVLGTPIAALTPISPLVGYSFSVTGLILGGRTSFGIVTDPAALADGYAATFAENFDRVLREAALQEGAKR
ncbi:wax ester/triacylglycerol synthase domain-containing protein [Nocardia harenae]|uniref:wax ester/triacylglycerol synthase domain-containing protein n=1 Tax=Nocardia harenae TaxID=358707 RepID=UPI0008360AF2|nr:wax ester/triacylglycerol synthase domain-containing protein [Nocardia harenae]